METILKGQNSVRRRPWLLILNRATQLLLRWSDVEAAPLSSRSRHEGELEGTLDGARPTHSRLHTVQALGCHVHEGTLHELVPVSRGVKPQRRAIGHQVSHLLTLRQLEHLGLVVAQGARGNILHRVEVVIAVQVGQVVANRLLEVDGEIYRESALLGRKVPYKPPRFRPRHFSANHWAVGLARERCHARGAAAEPVRVDRRPLCPRLREGSVDTRGERPTCFSTALDACYKDRGPVQAEFVREKHWLVSVVFSIAVCLKLISAQIRFQIVLPDQIVPTSILIQIAKLLDDVVF